jgi:hypothetical protein
VTQGEVDEIDQANGEVQHRYAGVSRANVGANVNSVGPLAVGVLVRFHTETFVQGRRLIGKSYFVPIDAEFTNTGAPAASVITRFQAIGDAAFSSGLTGIFPYVWSRPRPATAIGPGRPAGPARAARVGSAAQATSCSVSPKFAVLRSRRD